MKRIPLKAVLSAIFCNILFGSAVPMIKWGYAEFHITDDLFSKILFAGIRFFISGIIVWLIDVARNRAIPKVEKHNRINILWVALVYTFLQYFFNYIGISMVSGALSSVLVATSAFISVIVAHFVYKDDKITLQKLVGSVVGFSGVALMCLLGETTTDSSLVGEICVVLSAVLFVAGSMFNKRATKHNSGFTVTSYNLMIGGALLVIVGLIGSESEWQITVKGILILLYLIMVSAVGFTVWSLLLSRYPVGKLGVFTCIIPVAGALLSGLILGEDVFHIKYLAAFILVSAGIVLVNYRKQLPDSK